MEFRGMMRRLLVSADVQMYSRMHVAAQFRAQQEFSRVLEEAARFAGLAGETWATQNSGDGRLAILPPDALESAVVGPMAHRMDELLRASNRDLRDEARVRVRMAVNEGIVHIGDNGFPSDAINKMSHMRDSPVVKAALSAFPDAGLVLLVTDRIYEDIVEQGYDGIRRDRFRKVRVPTKNNREAVGWISVLNEDVNRVQLSDGSDPDPGPGADGDGKPAPRPDGPAPRGPGPAAADAASRAPGDSADSQRSADAAMGDIRIGRVDNTGAMSVGPNSTAYSIRRPGDERQ